MKLNIYQYPDGSCTGFLKDEENTYNIVCVDEIKKGHLWWKKTIYKYNIIFDSGDSWSVKYCLDKGVETIIGLALDALETWSSTKNIENKIKLTITIKKIKR